jgi:hypothetical protein
LADLAAYQPGGRQHARFGHVVADLERVRLLRPSSAGRQEAPADQKEIGNPRDAQRNAGGREVEQQEGRPGAFSPKIRNQKIRRGSDQGRHAAEQGRKRQRHQEQARRRAVTPCGRKRHRQHQGERGDVVHEARQRRAEHAEPGQMRERRAAGADQLAGERVDRA